MKGNIIERKPEEGLSISFIVRIAIIKDCSLLIVRIKCLLFLRQGSMPFAIIIFYCSRKINVGPQFQADVPKTIGELHNLIFLCSYCAFVSLIGEIG